MVERSFPQCSHPSPATLPTSPSSHAQTHTHAPLAPKNKHTYILPLLVWWRCFLRFDELLADALGLPAECVVASPPSFPLVNTIPSSIRPEAPARRGPSAPHSVLWVLSASPLVPFPVHTHVCLWTTVRNFDLLH